MIQDLTRLITRWHIGTGKPNPPRATLAVMAETIVDVIQGDIRPERLIECWMLAQKTTDWMPTGAQLIKAWVEVRQRPTDLLRLEGSKRNQHSCRWCGVVALRCGVKIPSPTDFELEQMAAKPSQEELRCVESTKETAVFAFWATDLKSPYLGML